MGLDSGIALVTGASRGIGRAVAIELARRGFDVVATVRRASDGAAVAELGEGRIETVLMDVTDPATYTVPDGLRVLVNNAGTDGDHVPVEHADIDAWRAIFDANLFGMVSLTRAAIPALRANAPSVVATIT